MARTRTASSTSNGFLRPRSAEADRRGRSETSLPGCLTGAGSVPAVRRVRVAVAAKPKAVLFELAERAHGSPFEILVACVITIRALEEVSLPTSLRLLEVARTPREMAKLSPARIEELIHACTFHGPKSRTIHAIAKRVVAEFGGDLPYDFKTLTSLSGLTLGIACGRPTGIPVDIHVHRVTNRWGIIDA